MLSGMLTRSKLSKLAQQRTAMQRWLLNTAPYTAAEQRHLSSGSPEQAYWHHGYQAALSDVLAMAAPAPKRSRSADN